MEHENALQSIVKKHGINNLTFKIKARSIQVIGPIAFTSSSTPEVEVSAQITEARYKLSDGYKTTLTPMSSQFPSEHFYQSDLISLIRHKSVKVEDFHGNPVDME